MSRLPVHADINGHSNVAISFNKLAMKIGIIVLRGLLGTCGASAWIGRSSEGKDLATNETEGLVLKDHREPSSPFPLQLLIDLISGQIRVEQQLVSVSCARHDLELMALL